MIGDGDPGRIVLAAALVHQEIIIAATCVLAWIVAAGGGARVIDRALAFFGIEELADAAEVFVALAAHQILVAVALAGEALLRRREAQLMIFGEALDIAFGQRDDRVRAAIAGTVQAIVQGHCGDRDP